MPVRTAVILFFLSVPYQLICQSKIDSLKKILATDLPDTTRCIVLTQLIEEEEDIAVWAPYNDQLRKLVTSKLKTVPAGSRLHLFYTNKLASVYNNDGYLAEVYGDRKKSRACYDKAVELFRFTGDTMNWATSLNNLGTFYNNPGDTAQTLSYFRASLGLMEKIKDKFGIANALGNIAVVYQNHGYFAKSIRYLEKSLVLWKELGDRQGEGTAINNLGICYYYMGDIRNALRYYNKSLKLVGENGSGRDVSYIYNNFSQVYLLQGDTGKALEYALKSLKIKERIGDKSGIGHSLREIGDIYHGQKKISQAIDCYRKSLAIRREVDDKPGEANTLNSIGSLYMETQPDTALHYFLESIRIGESVGDRHNLCFSLSNAGYICYKKNEKKKAFEYLSKALSIAEEIKSPETVKKAAKYLYLLYKQEGNENKALRYYEVYVKMKDSLNNAETNKAAMKSMLQFEYEKKELQVKNEHDRKIATLTLGSERQQARKNAWILGLVFALLLSAVGVVFFYNYFRQKNVIARQKESILKQKLLVSQMNPHFIFNSLNAIQNYIFKQDSLKAGSYLSQFAELMRMILDYSRRDLVKLSEEVRLLNNYFELQQLRFDFKFAYSIEVSEELEPSEILIPPMLAQPFIENAIEHGIFYKEGKGNVYLRIYKKEDMLVYEIEDDGVGLERSMELNKRKKAEHRSVATIITRERIDAMEQKGNTVSHIEITDLAKIYPERTGVKVTFVIPYQQT